MKTTDIHSSTLKVDTSLNLIRNHAKVGYFTGKYAVKFSVLKRSTYWLAESLNTISLRRKAPKMYSNKLTEISFITYELVL